MDTSKPAKVAALAISLLRRPRDLFPYLRTLPSSGTTPLAVALPWFSFSAIRELELYLRPHHEVFEFGTGGSTLFLAARAKRVLSVESHEEWRLQTIKACQQAGHHHVEIRHFPLDELDADFRSRAYFAAIQSQSWDVVIVDGFLGHGSGGAGGKGLFRPFAFECALRHVRPGGMLVLDDSWMFPDLLRAPKGWTLRDYQGVGPCRWGVTSTAIFRRDPANTGQDHVGSLPHYDA